MQSPVCSLGPKSAGIEDVIAMATSLPQYFR